MISHVMLFDLQCIACLSRWFSLCGTLYRTPQLFSISCIVPTWHWYHAIVSGKSLRSRFVAGKVATAQTASGGIPGIAGIPGAPGAPGAPTSAIVVSPASSSWNECNIMQLFVECCRPEMFDSMILCARGACPFDLAVHSQWQCKWKGWAVATAVWSQLDRCGKDGRIRSSH